MIGSKCICGWKTDAASRLDKTRPQCRSCISPPAPAAWGEYVTVKLIGKNTAHPNECLTDIGSRHSIGLPVHIYPLYENAFRAHRGQSIEQNKAESAQLYADFASIAEHNPYSWNNEHPAATEDTIGTVTDKNRMICFPCTFSLTMNTRLRQCSNTV